MPSQQLPHLPCGWTADSTGSIMLFYFAINVAGVSMTVGLALLLVNVVPFPEIRYHSPHGRSHYHQCLRLAPLAPRLVPVLPEPQPQALRQRPLVRREPVQSPPLMFSTSPSFLVFLISAPLGQSCPSVAQRPNVTCR